MAILRYGCGVRLDHDLVSKSWIGEEEIIIGSAARRFVNAGMAVWWHTGQSFSASASDGDLSALALRFARSVEVAAVDCAGFADWPALVFRNRGLRGVFVAADIFSDRALASDWARSEWLTCARGTLVADHLQYFADGFAHRACLRRRDDACQCTGAANLRLRSP